MVVRLLRSFLPRIFRRSLTYRKDNAVLNDQSNGPDYFKLTMANCGRSYFVKTALLAGTLLLLFILYSYKFESNTTPSSMSPAQGSFAEQWPIFPSSHSNQSLEWSAITSNDNLHSVENSTKPQIVPTLVLNNCPPTPPNLVGPINVSTAIEDIRVVESRFIHKLLPGGWYKPKECKAKERVAIIVPYRDRPEHIPVFFANIHPFLMKQQIEYGIFLVEQVKGGMFNKAAVMNVGFVESQKLADWDCFIFHDMDLLPMDDRNLYTCSDQPRHMSVAIDTLGFQLPYDTLFGGVAALTKQQFQKLNGFSNEFWGWGCEDDDMSNRVTHAGYNIARSPTNIARYTMIKHKKETGNFWRFIKLATGRMKFEVDGLNSLKYKLHYSEKKILYTWMLVEIEKNAVRQNAFMQTPVIQNAMRNLSKWLGSKAKLGT